MPNNSHDVRTVSVAVVGCDYKGIFTRTILVRGLAEQLQQDIVWYHRAGHGRIGGCGAFPFHKKGTL